MALFGIFCFALAFALIVGWLLVVFVAVTGGWGVAALVLVAAGVLAMRWG